MANVQYIGARYVPMFYKNPDDGTNNWKSGVGYEPLTVVTYLSNSYTSMKPVPGNIGNPADNPDYWILSGNYNAAITALQNDVGLIQSTIADYADNVKFSVNNVTMKRYYETGYTMDVVTIPRKLQNNEALTPIIRGGYDLVQLSDLDDDSIAACNIAFGTTSLPTNVLSQKLLINDQIVAGYEDGVNRPYLAIDENGDFAVFENDVDLTTLPALGYHYAAQFRTQVIKAGAYYPDTGHSRPNPFVHQNIGIDNDNYYIISFSLYSSTLDYPGVAAEIISKIPTIIDCYCLDGGGSTITTVAGEQTNPKNKYDISERGIAAALVFPMSHTDSNINTLSRVAKQAESNEVQFTQSHSTRVGTSRQSVSEHWKVANFHLARSGNFVFFNFYCTVDGPITHGWENVDFSQLPQDDAVFPKPFGDMYYALTAITTGYTNGRFNIIAPSDYYTDVANPTRFQCPDDLAEGDSVWYQCCGWYMTLEPIPNT